MHSHGNDTITSGITVLESKRLFSEDITRKVINISYPDYWFAPVKLSPFAKTIEEETIKWMDSLNLISNASTLAHLRAMEPCHYAGYSHSMAAYDHALVYCKYITMWLLWDDERVEVAKDFSSIEQPLNALSGELIEKSPDPYMAAFKHIGDEYERLGASRNWRIRFADKMKEWALNAIQEEAVRRSKHNADVRDFEDAVKLRAITVGIRPNSVTLERAVGIELPDYICSHSHYLELIDQAALICCLINDVVGVPKDINNNQLNSNLVLYYKSYFKTSLYDAYQAIVELHNTAVKRYDELVQKLLHICELDFKEKLHTFCSHLRYMDTGFGFWHKDCIRYQNLVALEKNNFFRLDITNSIY